MGVKRSERLHAMSEALRRRGTYGMTAEQLAQRFEVSVRTIKRDIAALETAGLPIWSRPGPGGGYVLVPGAELPPIRLTPAQAMALVAAVTAAANAPYADLAAAGAATILAALDPHTRRQAEQLAHRVWVDPGPACPRVIRSALEQAMTDQRVARIEYTTAAGEESRRDVEPIIFAATGGCWYLVAWCRMRNAIRWFALSRVRAAAVTRVHCAGHSIAEIGVPPAGARSAQEVSR
ncbi:WYL domain-containing protein [Corynebacterium uberis]|nr:WYL domain-containing protein [Corynebacterium uberis]UDL78044.1 WYL domain-containing protein [Corynebacterium uberis]UDL80326.1 WYL domain-containing protein [Corynebacterium uberis]UDL82462.1 WYL domain-containing protein [Corynebacterium uberis]UDL84668.1 WYL domain-containing protein [Corynebacterium uberis]